MFHLTTALDAASGVPLYEQLYESLAAEMRRVLKHRAFAAIIPSEV